VLGTLDLQQVVEAFAKTIRSLAEKPVLIGHSMGGLVTQLLLQKDLAAAGIAIDSAPPVGVFTTAWPFFKANWGHINPFAKQDQPVAMTFKRFQYCFVNGMPLDEQRSAFDRFTVPESRRVPRQALASVAKIDFNQPHVPLLLIAGSNDHLIPPSLVRTNLRRYRNSPSAIDYKEFPGRTHFIIGQRNWEEVADYCLEWLAQHSLQPSSMTAG